MGAPPTMHQPSLGSGYSASLSSLCPWLAFPLTQGHWVSFVWKVGYLGQTQVLRQRCLSVKLVTDSIPDWAKRSKDQQENTPRTYIYTVQNCNYSFLGGIQRPTGSRVYYEPSSITSQAGRLKMWLRTLAEHAQNSRLFGCCSNSHR